MDHTAQPTEAVQYGKELIKTKRSRHLGGVLEMYMRGKTAQQIATTLNTPEEPISKQRIEYILGSFRTDYINTLSSRSIIPKYKGERDVMDDINEPFMKLLSKSDEPLTMEEMLYCSLFVSTGNSIHALITAGLDAGLKEGKEVTDDIRYTNCLLRSLMLKRKPNVQEEIRRLQHERVDAIDVGKSRVLQMHIEMIERLQEEGNPKDKSNLVKLLDQVAKMTGAYQTNVNLTTVSADDVLDAQLALAGEKDPYGDVEDEVEAIEYEEEELDDESL